MGSVVKLKVRLHEIKEAHHLLGNLQIVRGAVLIFGDFNDTAACNLTA